MSDAPAGSRFNTCENLPETPGTAVEKAMDRTAGKTHSVRVPVKPLSL